MTMVLGDGRTLRASASNIRGEAERPHGAAVLRAKFLALAAPSWGDYAEVALRGLLDIDAVSSIAAWAAAGRAAAAARA
jgi:hypothetical protein